ncbi:PREDICTED: zinc finger BED domain-containing protein RICESLEEPER 2-like [Lupinus angustifolius]|uniref:zinc finger BED domain-containing protein RICESLEEPER 2-like n=1 Tax=Lupinus angustifolius TaxID=3871 RepID=UPI00092F9928|nr:PREDICTED: zinc finger BED domain-containing protein RICESLEEPER 2-like [Lupinus angustifolius]
MEGSGYNSNPINIDNEMNDVEDEIQESQSVEFGKSNKRPKSLTSNVWKSFAKIGVADDGIERAKCNSCKTIYKCGVSNGKDYDFIPVSRNTTKADVMRIYMIEKDRLKKEMSSIPTRISLTSDLWTACTTEGYICLTSHYVDSNWKLANNASSNDVMQEQLKNKLIVENSLLCDGQFFHVRCSAHILNLIVQEGLKVASATLYKIRESIKYVRGSKGRMLKFKVFIEKIDGVDTSAGLCLDVPTRWNSTYLMLEFALKYRHVFEKLHMFDDNYRDEDEVLMSMAKRMVKKFEKYWDDYSVVLAMGAILDPRMKLETLNYCFERVDNSTFETKLQLVKRKLYMLFEQYRSTSAPTSM